jgi:uncharacterized protein YecT (DUF1311 family)
VSVRTALAAALWLLLVPAATPAQDADCGAAATQLDMNICADRAWKAADDALNAAYAMARDRMRALDASLPAADRGAEAALRDAQRAWITFRDAACAAEGFVYAGGSIRPMVVSLCLARLTAARTADLRALTEGN